MKASINAPAVSVHDRTYQAQGQFSLEPSIAGLVAMMEAKAPVSLAMPAVAALQIGRGRHPQSKTGRLARVAPCRLCAEP